MTFAATFALAIVLLQQPAAPGPALPNGRIVSEVVFDIPHGIERGEVLDIVETAQGRPFSQSEVDLDIRELFAALPVRNVLVSYELDGELVRVRFNLLPRVVVGRINVTGNDALTRDDILSVLDLKEGSEYLESSLAKIAPVIRRLYADNGYFQASVEVGVKNRDDRSVTVNLKIDEGRQAKIGRVSLAGVPPETFGWLADKVDLESGEGFSQARLQEAREDLSAALAARGYRAHNIEEPVIEYDAKRNLVHIGQAIVPGPKLQFRFEGNRFFSDYDLVDTLAVDELTQLTPGDIDDFRNRIRDLYQRWGFFAAAVDMAEGGDGEFEKTYTYRIHEGEQKFVERIRFEGNKHLTDEQLYDIQSVRSRRFFDLVFGHTRGSFPEGEREANDAALLQAYREEGFLMAQITSRELATDPDGELVLTYTVNEGVRTTIDAIVFSGNLAFDENQLRRALGLNPGVPFNPYAFETALESLRRLYRSNGYVEAKVEGNQAFPHGQSAVVLHIDVNEGAQFRIGQIFIQGNTRTHDDVVRRSLLIGTGDILNPALLLATQRRLYQLGIFGSVNVEILSKDPQAKLANVIVKVQEKRNGTVDLGLEVGTAEGIILSAEVAHRNLFGTARSIRGRAEVTYRFETLREQAASNLLNLNEYRVETGYREPWLFDSNWAGTINLSTERNRRERTYNLNANRVIVGADREVGERWRLLTHYWWEKDVFFAKEPSADCDVDDARFDAGDPGFNQTPRPIRTDSPDRCDANPGAAPGAVYDLRSNVNLGTYYVAGFEPVLIGDYRNDRFAPTNGSLITYRMLYALPAVGSDFHFLRNDLTLGNYIELAPRWVIAVGIRTGYIRLLPPTDSLIKPQKYTLGGPNSVRGFGLYEIFVPTSGSTVESGEDGGNVMLNYQAELRFPLLWGLSGVGFQDAGQVWNSLGDVSFPLLYSAGTGLRYDTPIGPIRLDVGWKLNRNDVPCPGVSTSCKVSPYEIHFAIGNAF